MREFLIYVAYQACAGYETWSNPNSWVFTRAKSLVASIVFFHLIHLTILFADKSHFPVKRIESKLLLGGIITYLACFAFCEFLFTRKILNRSMAYYKEHWVNNYSKLFAFGYLIFAIALAFMMLHFRST
jgi:hypothetical protein